MRPLQGDEGDYSPASPEPRFAVDSNGEVEDREPLADWIASLP